MFRIVLKCSLKSTYLIVLSTLIDTEAVRLPNGKPSGQTKPPGSTNRHKCLAKHTSCGVLMIPRLDHIVFSKVISNPRNVETFPTMGYGIGHTGPARVEKRRWGRGGLCTLTNAHFAELDTLLSQHLGLRRVPEGRRLRIFEDLAVHGLVRLRGPADGSMVSDRAVAEAIATKRGRIELRKWRSLVTHARIGAPSTEGSDATFADQPKTTLTRT